MAKKKIKLVAVGLYVPGTGFTRVLTSLFSRLQESIEIHWLGIAYKGEILDKGYKLYPTNLEGGDIFGAYQMADLANEIEADVIFLLNDFWMLKNYERCLRSLQKPTTSIAYVPLDGKIDQPRDILESLHLDHIVCYNEFSLNELKNAFSSLIKDHQNLTVPQTHIIAHGTDLEEFYPFMAKGSECPKKAIKARIFPQIKDIDNSFVILNANRISARKALHLSLQSFARFSKNKNNVYLCLHLPNSPVEKLTELKQMIRDLDIQHKLLLNPLGAEFVSNDQLNALYNACDVGLNTSFGEGWGMIAFEHAATGAVQIVPNHTACGELWKDAGLLINVESWQRLRNNPFLMGKIDTDHLVELLNKLNDDRALLKIKSEQSFDFASSAKFSWDTIAKQWKKVIEQALKQKGTQATVLQA